FANNHTFSINIVTNYFFKMGTSKRIKTLLVLIVSYILLNACMQVTASILKGLKFERIDIPQSLSPGDVAELLCNYELGNDDLYAVKWYKDGAEFYRFNPKEQPQASSYKLEGVNVD
ncbi:hypothetical protein ILUMI_12359, partial [Ignelater luminosus]